MNVKLFKMFANSNHKVIDFVIQRQERHEHSKN